MCYLIVLHYIIISFYSLHVSLAGSAHQDDQITWLCSCLSCLTCREWASSDDLDHVTMQLSYLSRMSSSRWHGSLDYAAVLPVENELVQMTWITWLCSCLTCREWARPDDMDHLTMQLSYLSRMSTSRWSRSCDYELTCRELAHPDDLDHRQCTQGRHLLPGDTRINPSSVVSAGSRQSIQSRRLWFYCSQRDLESLDWAGNAQH